MFKRKATKSILKVNTIVEVDSNCSVFTTHHKRYTSNTIGKIVYIMEDLRACYVEIDNKSFWYNISEILYVVLPNIPDTPIAEALYD